MSQKTQPRVGDRYHMRDDPDTVRWVRGVAPPMVMISEHPDRGGAWMGIKTFEGFWVRAMTLEEERAHAEYALAMVGTKEADALIRDLTEIMDRLVALTGRGFKPTHDVREAVKWWVWVHREASGPREWAPPAPRVSCPCGEGSGYPGLPGCERIRCEMTDMKRGEGHE